MEQDPASWWQQHGINCLELEQIAIRLLSQTCTSFGCEHHGSIFDQIHSTRHNRLAQKRLNDFAYVHYSLHLRERQLKRTTDDSIYLDSGMLESLLDNWVAESEKPSLQEDEEILYTEAEQAEAYENEVNENAESDIASRKAHTEIAALTEIVEPLEVHHATMGAAADEDNAELDFLDDDLSD
ncbi:uncharacterized protein LOC113460982 [Phoenix dactylifera]|uniref:Uncharacterized protein LOC113460982 n=1 Tax=Phoenix dactylifera TaxID=42345 RepID=A0A8B8IXU6_PHODC|nr:uncharacterized protein LOC113460982 [Phoenix dactylifera]XP_038975447.1 uncharacterized protein LOC113460982 [Phoenix dactylifera]